MARRKRSNPLRLNEVFLAMVIGLGICFSILAIAAYLFPVMPIDVKAAQEVQEPRVYSPALLGVMRSVSVFGDPPVVVGLVFTSSLLYWILSYRLEAMYVFSTFLANGLTLLVKFLIERPRPPSTLVQVYERTYDPSFPSGHVVHYVVFFGFICVTMLFLDRIPMWLRSGVTLICLSLIVLIPFSRMYLGVHWASDVLGGFIFGAAFLLIVLHSYFHKKRKAVFKA